MAKKSSKIANNIKRNDNKDLLYQEQIKKGNKKHNADELPLLINPEDTKENPLTWERLMDWLANTGWVYGYVRKRISPMDAALYEDYAQQCWVEILSSKKERLLEVWHKGKGAFINYIKVIIDVQLKSIGSKNYKINKHFYHTHCTLSDEQWKHFKDGETISSRIDAYPVKYQCPSGNRKKMIQIEYEEVPIIVDTEYSLVTQ